MGLPGRALGNGVVDGATTVQVAEVAFRNGRTGPRAPLVFALPITCAGRRLGASLGSLSLTRLPTLSSSLTAYP